MRSLIRGQIRRPFKDFCSSLNRPTFLTGHLLCLRPTCPPVRPSQAPSPSPRTQPSAMRHVDNKGVNWNPHTQSQHVLLPLHLCFLEIRLCWGTPKGWEQARFWGVTTGGPGNRGFGGHANRLLSQIIRSASAQTQGPCSTLPLRPRCPRTLTRFRETTPMPVLF